MASFLDLDEMHSECTVEFDGVPLTVMFRVSLGRMPTHDDEGDLPECDISDVQAGGVSIIDLLSVAQLDRIEFKLIDRAITAQRVAARNRRHQHMEAAL